MRPWWRRFCALASQWLRNEKRGTRNEWRLRRRAHARVKSGLRDAFTRSSFLVPRSGPKRPPEPKPPRQPGTGQADADRHRQADLQEVAEGVLAGAEDQQVAV